MAKSGFEGFEAKWFGNETAKFSFVSNDLEAVDFDRIFLGQYNLTDDTFTDGDAVPGALVGTRIVAVYGPDVINDPDDLTPTNITLDLDFLKPGAATGTLLVLALQPNGREVTIAGSAGVKDLTDVDTATPGEMFGVVNFYAPTTLVEDFENGWPPASAGL